MRAFREFESELGEKLADLERFRLKKNKLKKSEKAVRILVRILTIPGLLMIPLTLLLPFILPITGIPMLIGVVLTILHEIFNDKIFNYPESSFVSKYKEEIMRWIIHEVDPNFKYDPDKSLKLDTVKKMELFQANITGYSGEDCISGEINNVKFKVSEGRFQTAKVTAGSVVQGVMGTALNTALFFATEQTEFVDNTYKKYYNFFSGLLMLADFHKSHKGSVLVIPNEGRFFKFLETKEINGKKKVEMGVSGFDETFNVYTTDNLEAHYILTPNLMDRILNIQKTYNAPVYLSFKKGILLMGIDWKKDLFELDINKPINTTKDLEFVANQLMNFETLIKGLTLDRRIWGEKALIE